MFLSSGDVDSRSIADQDKIVRVWENKIASGDVSIFPRQDSSSSVKKSVSLQGLQDFKSEVETDSIADLASTKSIWERKAAESLDESGPLSPRGGSKALPGSRSWDAGRGGGYRDSNVVQHSVHNASIPEHESAIEREIRLAHEREQELKFRSNKQFPVHHPDEREKGAWEESEDHRKMPIGKVPPPVRVVEVVPKRSVTERSAERSAPGGHSVAGSWSQQQQQQRVVLPELSHRDVESSTDAVAAQAQSGAASRMRVETLMERDIREAQEREAALRRDALSRDNFNKVRSNGRTRCNDMARHPISGDVGCLIISIHT